MKNPLKPAYTLTDKAAYQAQAELTEALIAASALIATMTPDNSSGADDDDFEALSRLIRRAEAAYHQAQAAYNLIANFDDHEAEAERAAEAAEAEAKRILILAVPYELKFAARYTADRAEAAYNEADDTAPELRAAADDLTAAFGRLADTRDTPIRVSLSPEAAEALSVYRIYRAATC